MPATATRRQSRRRIDPEQRRFLVRRTRNVLREHPELKPLLKLLLSHGGEFAILPTIESDLDAIITRGYIQAGWSLRMMRGRACQCHANSAELYDNNRPRLKLVTGYAMSDDGIWRQHTWLVDTQHVVHRRRKQFRIIETTTPRRRYFGFQLNDDEAEDFVSANFW